MIQEVRTAPKLTTLRRAKRYWQSVGKWTFGGTVGWFVNLHPVSLCLAHSCLDLHISSSHIIIESDDPVWETAPVAGICLVPQNAPFRAPKRHSLSPKRSINHLLQKNRGMETVITNNLMISSSRPVHVVQYKTVSNHTPLPGWLTPAQPSSKKACFVCWLSTVRLTWKRRGLVKHTERWSTRSSRARRYI